MRAEERAEIPSTATSFSELTADSAPGLVNENTRDRNAFERQPEGPADITRFSPLDCSQHPVRNALTVDVEDYFQVGAFERYVPRSSWDERESRVRRNTDVLLDLFESRNTSGTFFFLGWVAQRCPDLVRDVDQLGHEVASHGWDHRRLTEFDPVELRQDISRTKSLLEDITGGAVLGYRAPNFSIGVPNAWALDVIAETGHAYDCSLRPILGRCPNWPCLPCRYDLDAGTLLEFPLSTLKIGSWRLPFTGGNYLRQLPPMLGHWGLTRLNRSDTPGMLYIHPWEVDPEQPRIDVDRLTRTRHYRNLHKTFSRLDALLESHSFTTVRNILGLQ